MALTTILGFGGAMAMNGNSRQSHTYQYSGTDGAYYVVGQSLTGVTYDCDDAVSTICTITSASEPDSQNRILKTNATTRNGEFVQ